MIPIVEVADTFSCDVYELGRIIGRVVEYVDLKLHEFDIVNDFQRAMTSIPSFTHVAVDLVKRMLQQGVFLVQCLINWFVIGLALLGSDEFEAEWANNGLPKCCFGLQIKFSPKTSELLDTSQNCQ